ncbi:MobA/MobL family protein [Qipengyuania flava]|uniref:MobA/MobL family protein n=1 Tax=Qipengyuania flava TaxID=192812 RepID=UPI001CD5E6BC|nr:MobA/MobL family protein [Qipengyuania flava]MCA0890485.1 MobA/MobL family protein [Qipengyuania flava]
MLDEGKWLKATGARFDRLMQPGRTQRRLQASERTMEKARDRSARIRSIKEAKEGLDYRRSVLRLLRELGLSVTGEAWGRWRRIKVHKAPERPKRATQKRVMNSRGVRVNLPKYAKAIRDARGRVAVFLDIKYLGLKSKGWRKGLAADHAKYCFRADALEEAESQLADPISNIAKTPKECAAFWNAVEPMEEGYRANSRVQMRFVGALPHFLTAAQRRAIIREFGEQAFGRYGLGYMAAGHCPDPNGDDRNWHFHMLTSTRQVVRVGDHEWAFSDEKLTDAFTPEGLIRTRAVFAAVVNRHCRAAGSDNRYTHQKYEDRDLAAFRTEKIGPARMAAHEDGEEVAAVERNRRRIAANEASVAAQFGGAKLAMHERLVAASQRVFSLTLRRQKAAALLEQIGSAIGQIERVRVAVRWASFRTRMVPRGVPDSTFQRVTHAAQHSPTVPNQPTVRSDAISAMDRVLRGVRTNRHLGGRQILDATAVASSVAIIGKAQRVLARKAAGRLARPVPRLSLKQLEISLATARRARLAGERKGAFAISMKASVVRILSCATALSSAGHLPSNKTTDRTVLALLQRTQDAAEKAARCAPPIVARVSSDTVRTMSLIVASARLLTRPSTPAHIDRKAVRTVEDIHARAGAIVSAPNNRSIRHASDALKKIDARLAAVNRAGDRNPISTSGSEANLAQKNNSARIRPTDGNTSVGAAPYEAGAVLNKDRKPDGELSPLEDRVTAFTNVMREKPSGLSLADDGYVYPIAARADSWGLSKADLQTITAQQWLLPLYVDQELRLHRLEMELKFACISADDLADEDQKYSTRLSRDAAETLAMHRKSLLLQKALHRVYRELWLDEPVTTRTRQMTERGIDWRSYDVEPGRQASSKTMQLHQASMHETGIG